MIVDFNDHLLETNRLICLLWRKHNEKYLLRLDSRDWFCCSAHRRELGSTNARLQQQDPGVDPDSK